MEDLDSELIPKMKIPEYIFDPSKPAVGSCVEPPECPVLVFINVKSGGQLGTELLKSYRHILNPEQVLDLSEHQPDAVLHSFLNNLEKLKEKGDNVAESIQNSFKIIVAGGDGTAGWLLGVVGDLRLSRVPPIATVPLGTGNNLPYSFGWGKKNPGTDVGSVKRFLSEVYHAKTMNVDSWHVIMKMKTTSMSMEPIKLPHSLHRFGKVPETDHIHEPGTQTYRGGFWNYFSMGMDAQVSYEFHQKRQQHPELFKKQIVNQGAYAMIGVTQGWFLANCTHPKSRNINQLGEIKIKAKGCHQWKKLDISRSIRSIVMLNLPSFSGGLNPWGDPTGDKARERGITPAYVDDELIEIVGFRDGWHGLVLLAPNGHGTRLAQAHKVRIEFKRGAAKETYMRMDGEPWLQPLPTDDESQTVIEISPLRQVVMLATSNCIAKPSPDNEHRRVQSEKDESCSPALSVEPSECIEPYDTDHSSDEESSEAKRKFGAADTFKISS